MYLNSNNDDLHLFIFFSPSCKIVSVRLFIDSRGWLADARVSAAYVQRHDLLCAERRETDKEKEGKVKEEIAQPVLPVIYLLFRLNKL